jgi:large subunit ribosomal protein L29
MRAEELRGMSDADLRAELDDAKEEYFNLRFQRESGQLEDFSRIREVKRNIARVLTIIREQELAGVEVSGGDDE